MGIAFAEVIGDPIAQSKSPIIHKYWLERLGIEADYRATRVAAKDLGAFFSARRGIADWRGCNVTIPHKQKVMPLIDVLSPGALAVGAVNCVARDGDRLVGHNSDVDGVAAALDEAELKGAKVMMIGAGGGALAAIHYLRLRNAAQIAMLVRDPRKAARRHDRAGSEIEIYSLDQCERAIAGAAVLINASPMGMEGAAPMPPGLLACIAEHAAGTIAFDMVYKPLETAFLDAARANGGDAVDGLTMLVGQAASAFELFFGEPPPAGESSELRRLLIR